MMNLYQAEVNKFSNFKDWWDLNGTCRLLHQINPIRTQFICQEVTLSGQHILDIGCGGGILTETLAKEGGQVTGIDASKELIDIAKQHANSQGLKIKYEAQTAEQLAEQQKEQFDIITCMELLEHVPDPLSLLKACYDLLKPNGQLFISTLNRTLKAYGLAILMAEYVLRLLPVNTHSYQQFIKPHELDAWLRETGFVLHKLKGMHYNPLLSRASLTSDLSINYLAYASK